VDIELFSDISRIENALARHSCAEALAWCSENKTALRKVKACYHHILFLLFLTDLIFLACPTEHLGIWPSDAGVYRILKSAKNHGSDCILQEIPHLLAGYTSRPNQTTVGVACLRTKHDMWALQGMQKISTCSSLLISFTSVCMILPGGKHLPSPFGLKFTTLIPCQQSRCSISPYTPD
jgi:hypothetical protein